MSWYAVAFSIMATQASAITFTSTPGQAFADGMRFVQYYFGLPVAMVIISITAVPLYRRLNVYTAYEYLEHRFDLKTRTLTSVIFLIQRGLGAGMTIFAPSIIFSVMLGLGRAHHLCGHRGGDHSLHDNGRREGGQLDTHAAADDRDAGNGCGVYRGGIVLHADRTSHSATRWSLQGAWAE